MKHNLHGLKMVMVENFPWNIFAWNAVVFEKWVKHNSLTVAAVEKYTAQLLISKRDEWKEWKHVMGFLIVSYD